MAAFGMDRFLSTLAVLGSGTAAASAVEATASADKPAVAGRAWVPWAVVALLVGGLVWAWPRVPASPGFADWRRVGSQRQAALYGAPNAYRRRWSW